MSGEEGFIKLHRQIKSSAIYNAPVKCRWLWVHILLNVKWKTETELVGTKSVEVQPGEMITSYSELANEIDGSKSTVKRYMDCLRGQNMVRTQRETHGKYQKTRVEVVNWSNYQEPETEEHDVKRGTNATSNAKQNAGRNAKRNAERNANVFNKNKRTKEQKNNTKEAEASSEKEMSRGQIMGRIRRRTEDSFPEAKAKSIQSAFGNMIFDEAIEDKELRWILKYHEDELMKEVAKSQSKQEVFQFFNQYLEGTVKPDMREARLWKEEEPQNQGDEDRVDELVSSFTSDHSIPDQDFNRVEEAQKLQEQF